MGTVTKLLHKPLKAFTIYALLILAFSIPVYVLVVDYIWVTELDENNWLTLQHTKVKLQSKVFTEEDIEIINHIWGELQPGISIQRADTVSSFQDHFYEIIRPNEFDKEDGEDRFRGLTSIIQLNGHPYQITIETNVEESDETLLAVASITLVFFVLLILGFIVLNRNIAKKSWSPFYSTLQSLQSFDLSSDNKIHLEQTNIEEFEALHHSLRQLINRSVSTYQKQKSFIENAAHELQTPIALLKSKLDLIHQENEISPKVTELLSNIEAPLSRLSRINKNLLLLAKVENKHFQKLETIDLNTYLGTAIMLFEDFILDKNLTLTSDLLQTITLHANSFLVETLVHNLLSNAIRHTPNDGFIHVQVKNNSLLFSNSGIQALNGNVLFERFSMVTKDKVSSGLGLAIVKEICNQNKWKICYRFENGFHQFTIQFYS